MLVIGDWGTGSPEMSCRQGHPPRVAGADAFHFLAMTQRPTKLEVIGIDGDRIDSFSIPLDPGDLTGVFEVLVPSAGPDPHADRDGLPTLLGVVAGADQWA